MFVILFLVAVPSGGKCLRSNDVDRNSERNQRNPGGQSKVLPRNRSFLSKKMIGVQASVFFGSIVTKGCVPDAVVYNTLLDKYFSGGMIADVERLFDEMVAERRAPDEVTYAMRIEEFSKLAKLEDSLKIFGRMIEVGFKPDVVVYNKWLGSFRLDGIPPAPRGVPQIEVKFDIDANGILSVAAVDKGTQKKQDITITGASTLPTDEVEKMVKEAERFSKEKREAIDTKNQADSVVYQTEKQLKELGDKVPAEVKDKVEAILKGFVGP